MNVKTFPKLSFQCDMIVFCDCFICGTLWDYPDYTSALLCNSY